MSGASRDGGESRPPPPVLRRLPKRGLYEPSFEHDACGVGVVANIDGSKTHLVIEQGLQVLRNLGHRGACGADPETGDGAGITLQTPHAFFATEARRSGIELPPPGRYGIGMVFLPQPDALRAACERAVESAVAERGLRFLGWRDVPVSPEAIGARAREVMPVIRQCFVAAPDGMDAGALERMLYVARKEAERKAAEAATGDRAPELRSFYICSFSARTVVYKGLLVAEQIAPFYDDLRDGSMVSALALVHARFSTNTLGEWRLAHPYRYLAHNGEINTVRGNRNWMSARERSLTSEQYGDDVRLLAPVCEADVSDTASLDNAFELLVMGGREVEHVAAMMIPESWYGHESMPRRRQEFYEFHGCLMEPWDGPALVAFTDGRKIGAILDRNGLRPFRYTVTTDGLLVMASETGVLDIEPGRIAARARLRPGRMFLLDLEAGRIVDDDELKDALAARQPYGEWLASNRVVLDALPAPGDGAVRGIDPDTVDTADTVTLRQQAFGYTQEDLNLLMTPMAVMGAEPVGSMGNDAPLAVLSERPQGLYSYFKQLFAQVSNPPLDAIREELVTQLAVPVGRRQNLFDETPQHCRVLRIDHPILRNADLAKIVALDAPGLRSRTISTLFPAAEGARGLRAALDRIRGEASRAVEDGYAIVVLSDRGVDAEHAYVPALLAVGAIHHHLIRERTRTSIDIVVESGEPREVHHFATLFGYGASAVNPYLAFETLAALRHRRSVQERAVPEQEAAERNYVKAAEKGVLKVMSKMGISTLQGYQGAQIFEALGLSQALVDEFFTWTPTRIEGIGLDEIARDVLANHARAFPRAAAPGAPALDIGGLYHWRATGEKHLYDPETIALLQHAATRNDYAAFREYERVANDDTERLATIRGLLEFEFDPDTEIPLDEVEPAEAIVKRFSGGAISLGSISREAHETLAIAMNRMGARSNTGEGGEDPERFKPDPNGDSRSSRMKQVASGRFGVTTEYLVNATDLQIKMAQGSKPGEGGQIAGDKISDYIAGIRHTTPGVELISPPPHHDIYSIEDLAQLIHDLKNVNPEARVHVKLVSEVGVGIIAAGVSKGHGDVVLISGASGGTGNSPLTSIKHAGLPWELGIAETQQVLVANGLRGRIVVQVDGQVKTARDVAVATLLGAEEWGVATAALVVMGCIMLRKCHVNACSVGIATQDPELRKNFAGTPEAVVNYFMMMAESLREYMAKLGFRTVDEMVGRVERLRPRQGVDHWKARGLDLSSLLYRPPVDGAPLHHCEEQDHGLERALDHRLIEAASPAIERGERVRGEFAIHNPNRTVGAMMSGRLVGRHGGTGLPDGSVDFTFRGSAGQSFGAFLASGVTFRLEGDSNDYLAKGLSGGRIVVVPPSGASFVAERNIIIGNVALYGATGGEVFVRGVGGERFGVRNSAARAVIEGIGDHGCEYMTGGVVVVIGPTGRNFAAGMSGGVAYVWDPDDTFERRFNPAMASLQTVEPASPDEAELRGLLEQHAECTGSAVARRLLEDWERSLSLFKKVMPDAYARVLRERAERATESAGELVARG